MQDHREHQKDCMMKAKCTVVSGATFKIDEDSRERGEQLLKEAFRVLVQGTRIKRIVPLDCLPCRAQFAIQHIAGLLWQQSEAYLLDADLRSTLDCISQGVDMQLPDDLREEWDGDVRERGGPFDPWVVPADR